MKKAKMPDCHRFFGTPRRMAAATATSTDFVRFALDEGVLRFGSFKVKSGRISPYFFNAGLFNSGASVGRLAQFYAQALLDSGVAFDMLFGRSAEHTSELQSLMRITYDVFCLK